MTTSKPDWIDGNYPDYDTLVSSLGHEMIESEVLGAYQGDIIYVLKDGERVGFLVVGYGSCSGCDELEAVAPWGSRDDWTAVVALRDRLGTEVRWFDSRDDLAAYLTSDSPELQWWGHNSEYKTWRDKFVEEGV